ncbi:MAG: hypothetical protein K1X67_12995 [Fimbriimonadaceae bacterium]|nr:hypothetical protein [Fimbriimonadaceae bacterium]
MAKLTIVVNCTERKSQRPSPELQARSLPQGELTDRFQRWRRRVETAAPESALIDLYQGEAWQQARGLADDAVRLGFDVHLRVASAGLGLRDANSKAPAYAATFAGGHPDTVAAVGPDSKSWWKALLELQGSGSLAETAGKTVLLVLSESYARAMEDDLHALAERGGDLLLIGGAKTIHGLPRLPADMGLRRHLGGTASSITLRMARRWLASRRTPNLYSDTNAARWDKWAASVSELERYDRSPASDAELRKMIKPLKAADPTLSATRALRVLRDSGVACEQKRFAELFRSTGMTG